MPLTDDVRLISVDDHVIEHPTVWQDRVPERFRDKAPRIFEVEEDFFLERFEGIGTPVAKGAQLWRYEDRIIPEFALNAVAGKDPSEFGLEPTRYEEIRRGCYDPVARLEDLDADGVHGSLCFPSMPGFAGTQFLRSQDKELALACVQAYNDFQTDEWCAAGPGRLIPMMITPMWDPELCVAEIERMAAKGVKAITFPENTVPLGLPSFHTGHWDPVFAAAQDAGLPLCMHFGTSGSVPTTAPEAPFINTITLCSCNTMATVVDLLFSPVFPKFPTLKIALSEGGIGWIPYLIERSDFTWERHRHYQHLGDERPSDVFARHFFGCFIDDQAGLDMRERIGVDNIMWELDYPHSDSLWPGARAHLEKIVMDVPDDEVARMGERNARRVFGLD